MPLPCGVKDKRERTGLVRNAGSLKKSDNAERLAASACSLSQDGDTTDQVSAASAYLWSAIVLLCFISDP